MPNTGNPADRPLAPKGGGERRSSSAKLQESPPPSPTNSQTLSPPNTYGAISFFRSNRLVRSSAVEELPLLRQQATATSSEAKGEIPDARALDTDASSQRQV